MGGPTPWTLADDQVWRRTHRLAAKTFFGGGLLGLVACALLPQAAAMVALVALLAGASLWPVVASYLYWRGRAG